VIVTFVVGPRLKRRRGAVDRGSKDMTAEELARFDGKEGRPAYLVFRGRIFDVTGSGLWQQGNHLGRHLAGFDLTDALKQAPHGEDKVVAMPLIGTLVAGKELEKTPAHLRAFYFMTYFNLVLVLAVLLIVALWRWW
jgi:predicted heme/steroid binding protein